MRETQKGAHRSILWRLATWGAGLGGNVTANVTAGVVVLQYGEAISAFVSANWIVLWEVALTYGAAFADWFASTIAQVPDLPQAMRDKMDRYRNRNRR